MDKKSKLSKLEIALRKNLKKRKEFQKKLVKKKKINKLEIALKKNLKKRKLFQKKQKNRSK